MNFGRCFYSGSSNLTNKAAAYIQGSTNFGKGPSGSCWDQGLCANLGSRPQSIPDSLPRIRFDIACPPTTSRIAAEPCADPITRKLRCNTLCPRRGPEARDRASGPRPGCGPGPEGPGHNRASGPRPSPGLRARAGGSYNAVTASLEHLDISIRSEVVVVVVGP